MTPMKTLPIGLIFHTEFESLKSFIMYADTVKYLENIKIGKYCSGKI